MNNLAYVLYRLSRLKESEELHCEALNFWKINLKPNHQNIGFTMIMLADVLFKKNQMNEAEALYREALKFNRANLLPNDLNIEISISKLA